MGAITIDADNMVDVNLAAFRLLSDNLGDDVTAAFIKQFDNGSRRADGRRVTASQITKILERARAEAEAGRGKGDGDYTKEKYDGPNERSFNEYTASLMRIQSIMDEVEREYPKLSIGERSTEASRRYVARL
jgi:hypothetical protein